MIGHQSGIKVLRCQSPIFYVRVLGLGLTIAMHVCSSSPLPLNGVCSTPMKLLEDGYIGANLTFEFNSKSRPNSGAAVLRSWITAGEDMKTIAQAQRFVKQGALA